MQKKELQDIMHYEPTIWAVADYLIAAGIKQSKFPDYMMPFFALVMLEGRMLNEMKLVEEEEGLNRTDNRESFIEAFKDRDCGYNEFIVEKEKTLADICKSDKTFAQDFAQYLDGFDPELKRLLGIGRGTSEQKFLNMDGMKAELEKKGILMSVVSKWAEVDLSGYDNSAITTLEEHIKRRWADISAETAGEQYTPDDIISLIAELIGDNIKKPKDQFVKIYDPACGGANLLYGVADRLQKESGYEHLETFGSDFNDALYALAAIESRFRQDSHIKYGNTLTQLPFRQESFDVIVANPPYGISWKGYEKDIKKDESGQFIALPAVSDGQLLFMQHILWQLSKNGGFAVEVHNGSSLFSGDAGGGESEVRKYAFDNDWVEAIIQMPSDEFFNTGIFTYLWVFNKEKASNRHNKVLLIDASKLWTPMKKSKGSKRRYMSPEQRGRIREAFTKFENSDISKVFSKYHFYYNKQQLTLTDVDVNGETVKRTLCCENETDKGDVCKIALSEVKLGNEVIKKFVKLGLDDANKLFARLVCYDYKEKPFVVIDRGGLQYWYDKDHRTIIRKDKEGTEETKGQGAFVFKMSISKKTGNGNITLQIQPVYQKDYEIIPYVHDNCSERLSFGVGESNANEIAINHFLEENVKRPYYKRENVIGVELNYNKEFYVSKKEEKSIDIENDLIRLSNDVRSIHIRMKKALTRGLGISTKYKFSGYNWIGNIPENWQVLRMKDVCSLKARIGWKGLRSDEFERESYAYLVTGQDFVKSDVDWEKCYQINKERYEEDPYIQLKNGDILVTKDGTIGKVAMVRNLDKPACLNSGVFVIRQLGDYFDQSFFYWLLSSCMLENFNSITKTGATISHLYQNVFERMPLVCPPKDEQTLIANYLDEQCAILDNAITKISTQLNLFKLQKYSLINELIAGKKILK